MFDEFMTKSGGNIFYDFKLIILKSSKQKAKFTEWSELLIFSVKTKKVPCFIKF